MGKHVAAVLYGIGARLDERPELLFLLRRVDPQDLIAKADAGLRPAGRRTVAGKVLETDDLSQVFGIEIVESDAAPVSAPRRTRAVRDGPSPSSREPDAGAAASSLRATARAVAKKTSGTASRQAIRVPGLPAKQRAAVAARMKKYCTKLRVPDDRERRFRTNVNTDSD